MRFASDAYEAARGTLGAQDIIRYAQVRVRWGPRAPAGNTLLHPVGSASLAVAGP